MPSLLTYLTSLTSPRTSHARDRDRDDEDRHAAAPASRAHRLSARLPILLLLFSPLLLTLFSTLLPPLPPLPLSPSTFLYPLPPPPPIASNQSCSLFPLTANLTSIPLQSRLTSTSSLGLPSSSVLWEERTITCPSHPFPSMSPSLSSLCPLPNQSLPPHLRWSRFPGPYSKPGFVHLCHERLHEGAAFISMQHAFSGPLHAFPYNLTHAFLANPWYPARFPAAAIPLNASLPFRCYDEVILAHSMYDSTVGPHSVLEVAPIIAWLLDHTPPWVPIVARMTPQLRAMYEALGVEVDGGRLVAFEEWVVYHARRMWWFRRPEEFSEAYWASLRRRLFPSPLTPLPPPPPPLEGEGEERVASGGERALIVLIQRVKRRRSVSNHDELLAGLQAAFLPSRFDVRVFNGSLGLTAAKALFSRALVMVGPHGGAFLNALFMPPLSVVVEFAYPDHSSMPFPPYYYLQTCGLRLFHHITVAEEGGYRTPMTVNVSSVVHTIHTALQQREEERSAAALVDRRVFGERMAVKEVHGAYPWPTR